jgi:hypothetical protein
MILSIFFWARGRIRGFGNIFIWNPVFKCTVDGVYAFSNIPVDIYIMILYIFFGREGGSAVLVIYLFGYNIYLDFFWSAKITICSS